MLDIKTIRDNPNAVNQALKRRNPKLSVDTILAIDVQRRQLLQEEEALRGERNQVTPLIAQKKKAGEDTTDIQAKTRQLADRIKAIEAEKTALAEQQQTLLYDIPNMPSDDTPNGADESENVVIRSWGDEFKSRSVADPLNHWEIGDKLGILDFERSVKVSQSRFSSIRGLGAWLERAILNLMLDTHTANGYEVWSPPYLVNAAAMTGTGQLPKFEADMFACRDDSLYLIPTAEVPLTNMFAGEILDETQLPIHMTAHTPCFRREAGSAGKDTRGLIRQHQFHKVELVKLVQPENSATEHEQLVADAERVLQLLELPYRVVALCAGDIGFSATCCFDLEVWMPAQGMYREISSCSNFGDFQARRANLKYRCASTDKVRLLHTLNGSGLAIGRTLAAILENYQISHQEVVIPQALHRYWAQPTSMPTSLTVNC